jgi:hypothetical protein
MKKIHFKWHRKQNRFPICNFYFSGIVPKWCKIQGHWDFQDLLSETRIEIITINRFLTECIGFIDAIVVPEGSSNHLYVSGPKNSNFRRLQSWTFKFSYFPIKLFQFFKIYFKEMIQYQVIDPLWVRTAFVIFLERCILSESSAYSENKGFQWLRNWNDPSFHSKSLRQWHANQAIFTTITFARDCVAMWNIRRKYQPIS